MLEKLLNLLERFVVAVEVIAARMPDGSVDLAQEAYAQMGFEPDGSPDIPISQKDHDRLGYEELAAAGKRDELMALCTARGIIFPSRTRTETLVKLLRGADAALPQTEPAPAKEPDPFTPAPTPEPEAGPFAPAPEPEADPFAPTPEPVAPRIERAAVLAALQTVQKSKGNAAILTIFAKVGIKVFSEATEAHFPALLKEARDAQ